MLELLATDLVMAPGGRLAHHGSGWVGWAIVAFIVIAAVAGEVWLVMAARPGTDEGEDSDDGGGGLRRDDAGGAPRPPQPPAAGTDPEWWPEFESQFASHVARQTTRA
jgi:hypothetical protein